MILPCSLLRHFGRIYSHTFKAVMLMFLKIIPPAHLNGSDSDIWGERISLGLKAKLAAAVGWLMVPPLLLLVLALF
jgi:hypothetical protein